MKTLAIGLVVAALLAGTVPAAAAKPAQRWQNVATGTDRQRLAKLWQAWTRSLAQVQGAGQGEALAALGGIVAPDADMMNADPTDRAAAISKGPLPGPGSYRCRTIRLGQKADAAPAGVIQSTPPMTCRVEQRGAVLWLETSGSSRLAGKLFVDGNRMIFLGTTALAGETSTIAYGADPERDAVGALRAMAPGQWRLELPWPNWQSTLDIVEIVPS